MKFCSNCGTKVSQHIPPDDNRLRFVCNSCDIIHYQNPKIIAGCIAHHDHKVLLCRRAIEPRRGFWTLPAGFMENGETIQESAQRETWEEAEAKVSNPSLYTLFNLPHINQVYVFYRGEIVNGQFGAGIESMESQLFSEADIPWDELAFPTIKLTLKHFFKDRKAGEFPVKIEDITFFKKK